MSLLAIVTIATENFSDSYQLNENDFLSRNLWLNHCCVLDMVENMLLISTNNCLLVFIVLGVKQWTSKSCFSWEAETYAGCLLA